MGLVARLRTLVLHVTLLSVAMLVLAPVIALAVKALGGNAAPVRALLVATDAAGTGIEGLLVANSIRVSGVVALVCLILAPPAGYVLSRTRFPGRQWMLAAFVGVLVAPITLLVVPLEMVLNTVGLRDTHVGLIVAQLGLVMPLSAWLMKRAFDSVPDDLLDAARLEGASPSRTFWLVALPSARGAVFAMVAIAFAVSWSEYIFTTTLISKTHFFTVAADVVAATKPNLSPWARFAPAALIGAAPAVALLLLAQRRFAHFLPANAFAPKGPREE